MSNQRAGAKKENDSGSGLGGIGTKLLLAGGAAAIGYFVSEMLKNQEERPYGASSSQSPPWGPPPTPPSNSWGEEKSSPRKQHRDKMRDLNVSEESKCVVCKVNSREILLLPCDHVCLCEDCVEKISGKCPLCGERVRDSKVIYIP